MDLGLTYIDTWNIAVCIKFTHKNNQSYNFLRAKTVLNSSYDSLSSKYLFSIIQLFIFIFIAF